MAWVDHPSLAGETKCSPIISPFPFIIPNILQHFDNQILLNTHTEAVKFLVSPFLGSQNQLRKEGLIYSFPVDGVAVSGLESKLSLTPAQVSLF